VAPSAGIGQKVVEGSRQHSMTVLRNGGAGETGFITIRSPKRKGKRAALGIAPVSRLTKRGGLRPEPRRGQAVPSFARAPFQSRDLAGRSLQPRRGLDLGRRRTFR